MKKLKAYCMVSILTITLISFASGCDGENASYSKSSTKNVVSGSSDNEDRHSKYKHGDTKKTCTACNGTGRIKQYYTNDPNEEGHWEECVVCGGEGWYYE